MECEEGVRRRMRRLRLMRRWCKRSKEEVDNIKIVAIMRGKEGCDVRVG